MTRERKLAVQMWQEIKNIIIHYPYISTEGIKYYKEEFCKKHNLNWCSSCWFCQYIPRCSQCPLCTCGYWSVYYIMCDSHIKEIRLEACDKIIAALKGEYKYESE